MSDEANETIIIMIAIVSCTALGIAIACLLSISEMRNENANQFTESQCIIKVSEQHDRYINKLACEQRKK